MVETIPVLKRREVEARLEALGFVEARRKGAHNRFKYPDGRLTTVPFHGGRDIAPTLLRKIANDIDLTLDEFLRATAYGRSPLIGASVRTAGG